MRALFSFAIVLLAVVSKSEVESCVTSRTNGCSIPFGLPYFYKEVFSYDCHKHDVCYACGVRYGVSRSTCDTRFFSRIRSRCQSDSRVRNEQFCKDVTIDYYVAVRLAGWAHYENPSLDWCGESWVSRCL